jgi:hypothetical protein
MGVCRSGTPAARRWFGRRRRVCRCRSRRIVVGGCSRNVRLPFSAGQPALCSFRTSYFHHPHGAAFRRRPRGDQWSGRHLRSARSPLIQLAGGGDRLPPACGARECLPGASARYGIHLHFGRAPPRRGHGAADDARRERADPTASARQGRRDRRRVYPNGDRGVHRKAQASGNARLQGSTGCDRQSFGRCDPADPLRSLFYG